MLLLCEAKSPGLFRLRRPIVAALQRGGEECGKKEAKFDFSFASPEVKWSETLSTLPALDELARVLNRIYFLNLLVAAN